MSFPGPAEDAPWIENRPSTAWLPRIGLRKLWSYRELAFFLAQKDLKVRYKQTALGVAWAVIQPLAAVAIFTIVFGRLADLPSDGIPYAVFVYSGLIVWTYVSRSVDAAAQSLVQNTALVTKVYFPRLLAPIAAVVPGLLDFAISLALMAVFMVVYGVVPTLAVVLLPVWILAAVLTVLAVGLWLSALNVTYRDVRHTLPFLIQVWLFASPVVYPASLFEGAWLYVYALNPMVGVLEGFRWSLVAGPPPGGELFVSLAVVLLVFAGGLVYFLKVERRFADVI